MPLGGNSSSPLPPSRNAERVRRAAVTLSALSQNGLTFAHSDFDTHRWLQVRDLAIELLAVLSNQPQDELRIELGHDTGYATPNVDVRGALFDEAERVLLMRERSDGRWSLPGGWADPLDTPTAAVLREVREETGYDAEVLKLIACYDRDAQGHHPALPVTVYKLFFLCRTKGRIAAAQDLETLDVGWFTLNELPPLSEGPVLKAQLSLALDHYRNPSLPTAFD
jgi:ADP-ribose pyrophosphatase YjhB (NUDIX family)